MKRLTTAPAGSAARAARTALAALAALAGVACASSGSSGARTGSSAGPAGAAAPTAPTAHQPLTIVAGENFWGSIVAQLAGRTATVTSIVSDPNADPHQYEYSTADARLFADADYVVLNGAGYDAWADKLLTGNPRAGRRVLTIATLLGKKEGDNPHFWYDPLSVSRVADRIIADLEQADPADATYLAGQRRAFDAALEPYRERLAAIRARFSGSPVGATETVFGYLAQYLGLSLISPLDFMRAVAEGNDPPAPSVAQFQDEVTGRQMKLLVFNEQTVTAVTTNLIALAGKHGIPTVGITETVQPPGATFQQWQVAQLDRLQAALAGSAG